VRARKIAICAFSNLSCALCRGMKNWLKKTRRRDMVEFILPGSTAAFKKAAMSTSWRSLTFWHPSQGRPKSPKPADGRHKVPAGAVVRPSLARGCNQTRRAGAFGCRSRLNQMTT